MSNSNLSVIEAARRIGTQPRRISNLFYDGKLPEKLAPKVGRCRQIPESSLPAIQAALTKSRPVAQETVGA